MLKDLDDHWNAYWASRQETPPRDAVAEAAIDFGTSERDDENTVLDLVESNQEQTVSSTMEKRVSCSY